MSLFLSDPGTMGALVGILVLMTVLILIRIRRGTLERRRLRPWSDVKAALDVKPAPRQPRRRPTARPASSPRSAQPSSSTQSAPLFPAAPPAPPGPRELAEVLRGWLQEDQD